MGCIAIRDKQAIWSRLQRNPALHIYEIGDLDDFFWPHTRWFFGDEDTVALLYEGTTVPTLLAFSEGGEAALERLVDDLAAELPNCLYAHVSPGLEGVLARHYRIEHSEAHIKMALAPDAFDRREVDDSCQLLGVDDEAELEAFYASAYPKNWFDARMLASNMYLGIRHEGSLACVAGVHVVSSQYRVAALGNIATAPALRGRGLARGCTARLCARLFEQVDAIGLNVHRDNAAARRCYQALGFRSIGSYQELALRRP